ncbi:hypothetical protein LINPERHAP2_LOCUS25660 [Linum perenne]
MTVTRKSRGRPKKDLKGPTQDSASGSRFQILQREVPVSSGEPTKKKSSSEVSNIDSIIAEHAAQLSQILKKAGQPEEIPTDAKVNPAKTPKGGKPLADMTNKIVPQPPATSSGGGPARKKGAEGELFSLPVTYNNPVFQGVADSCPSSLRNGIGKLMEIFFQRKESLLRHLAEFEDNSTSSPSEINQASEDKARKELKNVLWEEAMLWAQKSRADWLVDGDRNTRYFHQVTLHRRSCNKIASLRDAVGN